jgi:hypothetical protein
VARFILIAALVAAATGCRNTCGERASLFNRGCDAKAAPVSYAPTAGPIVSYPASYSTPVMGVPTGGYPSIPAPGGAAELPMPKEMIPSPGLPSAGLIPPSSRSVGLPK